jgi:hypothetical protein
MLEKIEQKIDLDMEEFVNRRGDKKKEEKKGITISKQLILECTNCDNLEEISTIILRDKEISNFDQPI